MRIRTIKPEFFKHDELASIEPLARILFIGLWCVADRAGRLEDRPLRIKAEILPYDNVDVCALLGALEERSFIRRYEANGVKVIDIPKFDEHQRITGKEAETQSKFPEYPSNKTARKPGKQRGNNGETTGANPGNNGETTETTGREGKGKEGNGFAPDGADASPSSENPAPQTATKPRERNAHFDVLVELEGLSGIKLNDGEAGRIGKALKLIRQSDPEVTPRMIEVRAMAYRKDCGHFPPSAMGLATKWSKYRDVEDPLENDGRPVCGPIGDGDPR